MDYLELVNIYEKLESTGKRLEKTEIISKFLKKLKHDHISDIILLLQGRVFPPWDQTKIGIASKLVLKAISKATGITSSKIELSWKKTGDLGKTAQDMVKKKTQSTLFSKDLTVHKVFNNIKKLSRLVGMGSVDKKIQLIAELLTSSKPIEARYIVRTLLEDLRIGVGEGSLRDAIVWAFFDKEIGLELKDNKLEVDDRAIYNKYVEATQSAYDITNDFGIVIEIAKNKGISGLLEQELVALKPIKVMLALKVNDAKCGLERVGAPLEAEYKLDGFRMQIHKKGNSIKLFTRRLEDVTTQFPDVMKFIKENVKGDSFILDSETVGYSPKTKKILTVSKYLTKDQTKI